MRVEKRIYKGFLFILLLIILNALLLSVLEERLYRTLLDTVSYGHHAVREVQLEKQQYTENELVISFEEDGRFGNLLLETGTLLLVGRRVNKTVSLLPQVAKKLKNYFDKLPMEPIDSKRHCVCSRCQECTCEYCNKWHKMPSYHYHVDSKLRSRYLLLQWFDSNLVVRNLAEISAIYRSLLRIDLVNQVQMYLRDLSGHVPHVYVGVHVRRTDYINYIQTRYKGSSMDIEYFFYYCMNKFRARFQNVLFLVTSDDISWCKSKLNRIDVVFPQLQPNFTNTVEQDFVLLTQMNHTIYDYGSFGFWSAALAGGQTYLADNYSAVIHPVLGAIKKHKPKNWFTVDVTTLDKKKLENDER